MIDNCHILLLQEIILLDEDIGFLNEISEDINFIVSPSKRPLSINFDDRPSGGNAVIWKKSLNVDIQMKISSDT